MSNAFSQALIGKGLEKECNNHEALVSVRVTRMVNMMMSKADEMTELASFRPNPVN